MGEEGMGTFQMICFVSNNYEKGLILSILLSKKKKDGAIHYLMEVKFFFWVILLKNVFVELPILVQQISFQFFLFSSNHPDCNLIN